MKKDAVVWIIFVLAMTFVIYALVMITSINKDNEAEVQNLNRRLTELRLNCNNQEITEVLSQLVSPLAMDELRAMAEKLKQQKLRLKIKQSEE